MGVYKDEDKLEDEDQVDIMNKDEDKDEKVLLK